MARFECNDLAGLIMDLEELANMPDSVITDILNAEADIIVDAQKASARSMGVEDSGLTVSSIKKGKPKTTSKGKAIYVYPQGSRKRGNKTTRNAEIAFINEFGKHGQPARPFINTANEKGADKAVNAALKVYDDYLKTKKL